MPEIISCPDCDKKLRVPDDLLGKKVKCPGCSVMFIANGVGRADAEEEAPRRRGGRALAREDAIEEKPRGGRREAPPFEGLDERPVSRRRRDEEDEEDDRPRARRRREDEEDEEDDRPGARRRRDDEDEDYPRSRRPRYEDEDEDEAPRPRNQRKGWQGVRTGLNLVVIGGWLEIAYYGAAVLGAGLMFLLGASLIASLAGSNPNAAQGRAVGGAIGMGVGLILLMIVLGILALGEVILRVTGYGLTMQVLPPRRHSALKGLSIAAFACACGAIVVNVGGLMLNGFSGLGGGPAAMVMGGGASGLGWLSGLLRLASFVLFLLFLRSVCANLRDDGLARTVVMLLIAWCVFYGVAVLTVIVLVVGVFATMFTVVSAGTPASAGTTLGVFGIFALVVAAVVGLAGLALCVWYVLVVTQVRNLVDRRLKKM
jgi:hypothetical protein